MTLFNAMGNPVYERVVHAHPGNHVCLFDKDMNQLTPWVTIGEGFTARWEAGTSTLSGMDGSVAVYQMLWNGENSFTRVRLEIKTIVRNENSLEIAYRH